MPPFIVAGAVLGGVLALILRPHVVNVARTYLIKKSWDLHLEARQFQMEALWDTHLLHEFSNMKDVAATLNTMGDTPYVNHVPTMIGGIKVLQYFYSNHFYLCEPANGHNCHKPNCGQGSNCG